MRRRDFIKVIAVSAAAWPRAARAQQPSMPVVGVLSAEWPNAVTADRLRAFREGAKKVGVSREYLSRAFGLAHNEEALRTRALREVALSSGRAAARLNQLIDSTSQRVALEATKFSLGVAGIKPPADAQVNVNLEIRAGYVLDLREYDEPAAKIVGGEAKVIGTKPAD